MTTIESELEYLRKKLTMYSKLYEKRVENTGRRCVVVAVSLCDKAVCG